MEVDMDIKGAIKYFSPFEIGLWLCSVTAVALSYLLFGGDGYSTAASLIGVTSLIFLAKGNPVGQVLMIIFGTLYGIISFGFAYYGEMITYVGMTVPMALLALISWLRNPYKGRRSEVRVAHLGTVDILIGLGLTAVVTVIFYFILGALGTANLLISTFSVTTSFFAVYLTFRRSAYYALAYAANDLVLIVMWIMATLADSSYLSVVVCFVVFLVI